jgi:hypothetical protein
LDNLSTQPFVSQSQPADCWNKGPSNYAEKKTDRDLKDAKQKSNKTYKETLTSSKLENFGKLIVLVSFLNVTAFTYNTVLKNRLHCGFLTFEERNKKERNDRKQERTTTH